MWDNVERSLGYDVRLVSGKTVKAERKI